MMRSKHYFAVACRRPDGEIVVQREEVDRSIIGKLKWLNRPFLRGTLALIDAMALGTRALRFSSEVQLQAEAASKPAEPRPQAEVRSEEPPAESLSMAMPAVAPEKAARNGS